MSHAGVTGKSYQPRLLIPDSFLIDFSLDYTTEMPLPSKEGLSREPIRTPDVT